jgi:arylsulfatase A-like enzyme
MTGRNLGHDDFERRASETVERALAWLAEDRSRPTFLWVHLYDPHGRYDPGEELASRFYRKTGRPALRPEQIVDYQRRDGVLDPDLYVAHYDGEIRVADRAIGALVVGMGERAVVAVTADHGEGLGEHDYWFRHGSRLDAAALHVPLVIAGPGVPSGKRVERLVMNLDVAPTLLDLALGESFPDARGVSLSGRFDADSTPARVAFSEARRMGGVRDGTGLDTRYKVAATTDRHRLVLWPESGQMALYDLQADPGETIDVSGTTPDVLAALRGQIRRFLAVGDRLPGEAAPSDVVRALEGLGYLGGRSK